MKLLRLFVVSAALLLLGACAGMPMPGSGGMPDFSQMAQAAKSFQSATRDVAEPEEIEIGQGVAQNLLGAWPLVKDDRLQRYVNQVGRWLALQTERPDLPWTFGVVQLDTVNAFAAPGGAIFITNGMLRGAINNEAELAGVLAHEIAHVLQKHHLNAMKAGAFGDIGKMGVQALLDNKLGKAGVGGQVAKSVGVGEMGAELIKQGLFVKPLDRSLEYESDRMGVIIAARAGYDPYGLVAVLQILQAAKPESDAMSFLLKTHPSPNDRLAQLEKVLATLDGYQGDQGRERFAAALGLKVERSAVPATKAPAKAPAKPAAKPPG